MSYESSLVIMIIFSVNYREKLGFIVLVAASIPLDESLMCRHYSAFLLNIWVLCLERNGRHLQL